MLRYVYGIREKVSQIMRYIGVGKEGQKRMYEHLRLARRGQFDSCNPFKGQFLIEALLNGVIFEEFKIAENISLDEAYALEIKLIAQYGRLQHGTGTLLNNNAGGAGGRDPAPSTRAKIRQRLHQRWTPEARSEMSEQMSLRMAPPEARAKQAEITRQQMTPEARARIGEAQRRKWAKIAEIRAIRRTGRILTAQQYECLRKSGVRMT